MVRNLKTLFSEFNAVYPNKSFLIKDELLLLPLYLVESKSAGACINENKTNFNLNSYAINKDKLIIEPVNKQLNYSKALFFYE